MTTGDETHCCNTNGGHSLFDGVLANKPTRYFEPGIGKRKTAFFRSRGGAGVLRVRFELIAYLYFCGHLGQERHELAMGDGEDGCIKAPYRIWTNNENERRVHLFPQELSILCL